jgi:hypothetical protein
MDKIKTLLLYHDVVRCAEANHAYSRFLCISHGRPWWNGDRCFVPHGPVVSILCTNRAQESGVQVTGAPVCSMRGRVDGGRARHTPQD